MPNAILDNQGKALAENGFYFDSRTQTIYQFTGRISDGSESPIFRNPTSEGPLTQSYISQHLEYLSDPRAFLSNMNTNARWLESLLASPKKLTSQADPPHSSEDSSGTRSSDLFLSRLSSVC